MEEDLRLHIRQHPEVETVYLNEVLAPEKTKNTVTKAAKKIFSCKRCNSSFATQDTLDYHIRNFHGRERFHCDQCSRGFVSKSSYLAHLEYHKKPNSQNFICKICNLVFHAANSLVKHNFSKHVHGNRKLYKCKVCTKEFVETDVLVKHMRLHNKKPYKFKCKLCSFGANSTNSLDRHLSKNHGQKFNCKLCNLICYSEETLNRHIQRNHKLNQRYHCNECSRIFDSKKEYETHLACHKRPDVNRYKCEICNFVFQTRSGLGSHRKVKHSTAG